MTDKEIIAAQKTQIEDLYIALDDRIQKIKRLEAEVERLNSCVKTEDEVRAIMESSMQEVVKNLVAEQIEKAFEVGKLTGITELADKLIDNADIFCTAPNGASKELFAVPTESIKNIVKEMTEDSNE